MFSFHLLCMVAQSQQSTHKYHANIHNTNCGVDRNGAFIIWPVTLLDDDGYDGLFIWSSCHNFKDLLEFVIKGSTICSDLGPGFIPHAQLFQVSISPTPLRFWDEMLCK
nr:uncharacterized protein LOC113691498 isoform X2 [Coffea arabica]